MHVRLRVNPVTAAGALRRRNQAAPLIVADGLGGHARGARSLADIHGQCPLSSAGGKDEITLKGKVNVEENPG